MTEQQLDATKRLAERFGSDLSNTTVLHDPHGLPDGWISTVVYKKGTPPADTSSEHVLIVAGISPAGEVNS